jgi:hypothetical protein
VDVVAVALTRSLLWRLDLRLAKAISHGLRHRRGPFFATLAGTVLAQWLAATALANVIQVAPLLWQFLRAHVEIGELGFRTVLYAGAAFAAGVLLLRAGVVFAGGAGAVALPQVALGMALLVYPVYAGILGGGLFALLLLLWVVAPARAPLGGVSVGGLFGRGLGLLAIGAFGLWRALSGDVRALVAESAFAAAAPDVVANVAGLFAVVLLTLALALVVTAALFVVFAVTEIWGECKGCGVKLRGDDEDEACHVCPTPYRRQAVPTLDGGGVFMAAALALAALAGGGG